MRTCAKREVRRDRFFLPFRGVQISSAVLSQAAIFLLAPFLFTSPHINWIGLHGAHGGLRRYDTGLSRGGGAYSTAGSREDRDAITKGGRLEKSKPRLEGSQLLL